MALHFQFSEGAVIDETVCSLSSSAVVEGSTNLSSENIMQPPTDMLLADGFVKDERVIMGCHHYTPPR